MNLSNCTRIVGTGLLVAFVLLVGGCMSEKKESPTKGRVHIVVDESVAPLFSAEQQRFEELYPEAKVHLDTAQSREAIVRFFNIDSTKVIATARALNDEERDVAKRTNFTFQEFKVAINAVAVIVNPKNTVGELRLTQLDSVFRGVTTTWSGLGSGNPGTPIAVCLPDQNSGAFEIVAVKVLHGAKFASPASMAKTSPEMIAYVSSHPNSIGIVGLNWLRNTTDSVKVLELRDPSAPDSLKPGEYFSPHQAYVYEKLYPLTGDVYMYSKTDSYSPGSGFIAFVTSGPGQKIVLNTGLVPATMPVRLVHLSEKGSS